jgi:hypothetical protein
MVPNFAESASRKLCAARDSMRLLRFASALSTL